MATGSGPQLENWIVRLQDQGLSRPPLGKRAGWARPFRAKPRWWCRGRPADRGWPVARNVVSGVPLLPLLGLDLGWHGSRWRLWPRRSGLDVDMPRSWGCLRGTEDGQTRGARRCRANTARTPGASGATRWARWSVPFLGTRGLPAAWSGFRAVRCDVRRRAGRGRDEAEVR